MDNMEENDNIMEEKDEDRKAPIIIALVVLFLLIVAAIAYFSANSLSAPTNLRAVVEGNSVVLLWDKVGGENIVGYRVYRAVNEDKDYQPISEVVEDNTYIDSGLAKGTYYYVIRTVGENNQESSDSESVKVVIGDYPKDVELILGNGSKYINKTEIEAKVRGEGIEECNFVVNEEESGWTKDLEQTLGLVEGKNVISVQCRNNAGVGDRVEREVYVDTSNPDVSISLISIENNNVNMLFEVFDENSLSCRVFDNEELLESFTPPSSSFVKSYELEEGDHVLSLECFDLAGNKGGDSLALEIIPETNEEFDFYVLINSGSLTTTSRVVEIEVIGENIESCRYTNENLYPDYKTDWLPYTQKKIWELSPFEGKKTVYVECVSKDGTIKEKSVSIDYERRSGSDDGGSGGSSGSGGNNGNNTGNQTNNQTQNQTNQTNYSATADYIKIKGYVKRGDSLILDENVASFNMVKVEVASTNGEEGKLWNSPYVYNGIELNLPDVVDREDEAPWDPNKLNGIFSFELIKKKKYTLDGGIVVNVKDGMRVVNFKVRNSKGESNTISDSIFYDATAPKIKSVSYELSETLLGGMAVPSIVFTIDADDNGDDYGYGLYGIKYKRYSCESGCDDLSNYMFDKEVELSYSPVFTDYPLENGKTYKYKIFVSDYAGHYSSKKKVFVEVNFNQTINNTNNTNASNASIKIYYIKNGLEYELIEGTPVSTQEMKVVESGFDVCEVFEKTSKKAYFIAKGDDEINFTISNRTGWHTLFVVCTNTYSDYSETKEVSFYYDNIKPKISIYAKPTKNKTITISLKAKDDFELRNISVNSTYVLINKTCLVENGIDVDELPYSKDPLIFYPSSCFEFNSEIIYVNSSIDKKKFKKKLEINPIISTKEIKVLYLFTALVYDKAENYNLGVSNPIISHPICYKYDLDFCYFEGKIKHFSKYVEEFILTHQIEEPIEIKPN